MIHTFFWRNKRFSVDVVIYQHVYNTCSLNRTIANFKICLLKQKSVRVLIWECIHSIQVRIPEISHIRAKLLHQSAATFYTGNKDKKGKEIHVCKEETLFIYFLLVKGNMFTCVYARLFSPIPAENCRLLGIKLKGKKQREKNAVCMCYFWHITSL